MNFLQLHVAPNETMSYDFNKSVIYSIYCDTIFGFITPNIFKYSDIRLYMSIASAIKYVLTNGLMMLFSIVHYIILMKCNFIIRFLSFILKNVLIVGIVNIVLKIYRKLRNLPDPEEPKEEYKHELKINLVKISCLEYFFYELIYCVFPFVAFSWYDIAYFIPVSFMYEIIFDFFHYWTHRLVHSIPYLYKKTHKLHHRSIILSPILTFVQDPVDLALTNFIPIINTLAIFYALNINLSLFTYACIMMYKSYVEISGHGPVEKTKSCAFPQFIWFPKMLKIELYARNHNKHHTYQHCNFSKRFCLWDKVFGTWKE